MGGPYSATGSLRSGLVCLLPLIPGAWAVVFPPASTNCTDGASRSVSWEIGNFTYDTDTKFNYGPGTAGKVSFTIKNSANGYEFGCLQGNGETGRDPNFELRDGKIWYSCNVYCHGAVDSPGEAVEDDPPLDTSFYFDLEAKALSISQDWSCRTANASQPTNYTAVGTSVVQNMNCQQIPDGRPDQVACAPVASITIKASNVSTAVVKNNTDDESAADPYGNQPVGNPFAVPFTTKPGVVHNTTGCSKASRNATWTISKFTYSDYGVRFNLVNNALNYSQSCSLGDITALSESRLHSRSEWNCTRFDPNHVNYPMNGVYTTLIYGGSQNVLGVNQTWYCDDEDTANNTATVFSAYAEARFPLKCKQSRYCEAPGKYQDRPVRVVSDSCTADEITVDADEATTKQVPRAQAVEEFKPHGYNCTARSLGSPAPPAWNISRLSFNRTWVNGGGRFDPSGFQDSAEFYFANTATDSDWPRNNGERACMYSSNIGEPTLNGTLSLACSPFGLGRDPEFKFDFNSSVLSLNQKWSCDGMDQSHTNYFEASGSVHLSLHCAKVGNGTSCGAVGGLSVPMANMTTKLNSAPDMDSPYGYGR